jgi:hypothetical protein
MLLSLTKYPEDDLGKNQVDNGYDSDNECNEDEYDSCIGSQHLASWPYNFLKLVKNLAIEKSNARENAELCLGLLNCISHGHTFSLVTYVLRAVLAGQEGLEPPTGRFGDGNSSQLSYCPSREIFGAPRRANYFP